MKRIIVADSSSNLYAYDKFPYKYVPLKIYAGTREYVDNEDLVVEEMVHDIETSKDKLSTSCPNYQEWMEAFEGNDEIVAVTISSKLSGSYNSAVLAANDYMEEHPGSKVWVLDSRQTGAGMAMLMDEVTSSFEEGCSFEQMKKRVEDYWNHLHLCFLLGSVNNLARNGRLNPLLAKIIGALDIKMLGRATLDGVIDPFGKFKGIKKGIKETFNELLRQGYNGGKVVIDHVLNLQNAETLKGYILEKFPDANVIINSCKGLCSFYAERNGLIVGFEGQSKV